MTLSQRREQALAGEIRRHIVAYLSGRAARRCATCGEQYRARNRYHFFCCTECREDWYRGQFHPRKVREQKRGAA